MAKQIKKNSTKQTTKRGHKGGISNLKKTATSKTATTAAAGAAIGAAIGGVAGAALSTDKGQEVMGEVVSNLGEYAQGAMEAVQTHKGRLEETTKAVASDAIKKAER